MSPRPASVLLTKTGAARVAALVFVVASAAYLRLRDLGTPGLWLDEIFGVIGMGAEHGPVYYLFMRLGLGHSDAVVRFPFVLAGMLTVVLTGFVARRWFDSLTGTISALLLAVSPVHVYYSREARPYAFLLLGWTVSAWLLFHLMSARRWGLAAILLPPVLYAMSMVSALAALYLPGLGVFALCLSTDRSVSRWHARVAVLAAAMALGLVSATWQYGLHPSTAQGAMNMSAESVGRLLQPLVAGTSEEEPLRPVVLLVAAVGLFAAFVRRDERSRMRVALLGATMVGIATTFVVFWFANRWLAARYFLCALIPLSVLLACGVASLLSACRRCFSTLWSSGRRLMPAMVVALVLAGATGGALFQLSSMARGARLRADWRRVAQAIGQRSSDGHVVVASNPWNAICLRYHLPRVGSRLQVQEANESLARAMELAAEAGSAFLVSGPYDGSPDVPAWMARFHPVYESPVESISVTAYPISRKGPE